MAHVENISVALTPEMVTMLREAVGTGAYACSSELIREALREWRGRREYRGNANERLGQLWDAGLASGNPVASPKARMQVKNKLDKATLIQSEPFELESISQTYAEAWQARCNRHNLSPDDIGLSRSQQWRIVSGQSPLNKIHILALEGAISLQSRDETTEIDTLFNPED